MTIAEIIADLQHQVDWRGPSGQPQGNIVIHRNEAITLLEYLKQLPRDQTDKA